MTATDQSTYGRRSVTTPPALELIDLHASYGRIEVVHGINLIVPPQSIVAILGPNGAGKTTTLKVIDGRHPASRGCVHIAGQHVNGAPADSIARASVCSVPEGRGIFPNLTVAENLWLMTQSRPGLSFGDVQQRAYARFPILGERRKQLAGTMSGGQQQMLAIARAVVTDPALLLVDELSMGLAPLIVKELYEVLAGLSADGMAVLLVEQFARTALAIADFAALMVHGEITAVGQPADLDEAVAEAYLGSSS
ncbi:MAG TPA: ABC transporter ATP-binding protein [Acidimicrobiales bacterium]|nr:ABC transporter ATP-binding protein [Acidimicrobiales bacterium]